jgi:hypothetical protein
MSSTSDEPAPSKTSTHSTEPSAPPELTRLAF